MDPHAHRPAGPGAFTARELAYLADGPRLARVATIGRDGTPHVVPSGWTLDRATGTVLLRGAGLERTKKYRDAAATGRIALVIDDVAPPWKPRGIEIRGRAETSGPPNAHIRVHPERIISWGLESNRIGERHAGDVRQPGRRT